MIVVGFDCLINFVPAGQLGHLVSRRKAALSFHSIVQRATHDSGVWPSLSRLRSVRVIGRFASSLIFHFEIFFLTPSVMNRRRIFGAQTHW